MSAPHLRAAIERGDTAEALSLLTTYERRVRAAAPDRFEEGRRAGHEEAARLAETWGAYRYPNEIRALSGTPARESPPSLVDQTRAPAMCPDEPIGEFITRVSAALRPALAAPQPGACDCPDRAVVTAVEGVPYHVSPACWRRVPMTRAAPEPSPCPKCSGRRFISLGMANETTEGIAPCPLCVAPPLVEAVKAGAQTVIDVVNEVVAGRPYPRDVSEAHARLDELANKISAIKTDEIAARLAGGAR